MAEFNAAEFSKDMQIGVDLDEAFRNQGRCSPTTRKSLRTLPVKWRTRSYAWTLSRRV